MEKLKIKDFTDYQFLSDLKFSPDGNKLCFVASTACVESNSYLSRLWVYDLDDESLFKLTTGKDDNKFVWLDRETIIFLADRDEVEDKCKHGLYLININGGEASYFASIPFEVKDLQVVDNNTLLLSGLTDIDEKQNSDSDYQVLDEIPFWTNEDGFRNKRRVHLYSFDLGEKKFTKLIDGKFDVLDFSVCEDQVCINMRLFEDKMDIRSALYLYNLAQGDMEKLTATDKMIGFVNFKDYNSVIYSATDMKAMGVNTNKDIFEFDLEQKKEIQLTHNLDKSFWLAVNSDCRLKSGYTDRIADDKLYFLTTEDYNTYLNVLADSGVKRLIDNEGSIDMFDICGDKIAFIAFRGDKLQELYIYENGQERRISEFNTPVLADKSLSSPEYFSFETSDGCELDAWIMKPVDFKKGNKYPAILEIHGGPMTTYGSIFFHQFQVMASRGYVVVYTNPRGSNGRGHEFADIRGDYGGRDYEDLLEFMDIVLDRFDFIDQDRLGVTGGSYGGYMTNWIISHTDRFKAAVSQRGIANWTAKYCTSDIGYYFVRDQFADISPWSDYEKLWDASPLKYADQIKTPTLFIHSEQDYRCWLPEGIQMFTSLKYHDIDSRLVIFKGENHELSRSGKPQARIRRLQEIMDWFAEYL